MDYTIYYLKSGETLIVGEACSEETMAKLHLCFDLEDTKGEDYMDLRPDGYYVL